MPTTDVLNARVLGFDLRIMGHGPGETVSDIIRRRGCYSRNDVAILKRLLRPGDAFVDVGANIGWHSMVAARLVGAQGKVYAFEPAEDNFRLLEKNIPGFHAIRMAVADSPGQGTLYRAPENSGDHMLGQIAGENPRARESVEVTSLDRFFGGGFPPVRFVKIDAQGSEPKILAGMRGLLEKCQPAIMIEFSPRHIRACGGSPFEFFAFLDKSGYVPFRLFEDDLRSPEDCLELLSVERLWQHTGQLLETGLGIDILLLRPEQLESAGVLSMSGHQALPQLANILLHSGHWNEARLVYAEIFKRAATEPERTNAALESARLARRLCLYEDSRHILEQAAALAPLGTRERAEIDHKLGWHELRDGFFKRGLAMDRVGRKLHVWGALAETQTRPMLTPMLAKDHNLAGRTVLVCGEGGIGDELTHARFAAVLNARGAQVIWKTDRPIASLLSRTPGISKVISAKEQAQTEYDFWAPCSELALILDLDANEIPREPYIFPDPQYVTKWRTAESGSIKIGLRWGGDPGFDALLGRGVPFVELLPLLATRGVRWFSLQTEKTGHETLADNGVTDWGARFETWEDTAAAISQLDLVITTCTSVAHLAAAIGKPVWLLCGADCYYIWASRGDTSPWYKSVRIFRQAGFNTWKEPISRITALLGRMLHPALQTTPAHDPASSAARIAAASSFFESGNFEQSRLALEGLCETLPPGDPNFGIARFNLHWHRLRQGRFKEGIELFFGPEDQYIPKRPAFPVGRVPKLSGQEELAGKRVLCLHEAGGAGDEIINARFAERLKARGARVFWRTNHGLDSLFSRVNGIERAVREPEAAGLEVDYWAATGTLLRALDLDLASLPRKSYLSAHPDSIRKWKEKIPHSQAGLKVGVRWQGGNSPTPDARSVPYEEIRKLFGIPGVSLYSLQRDFGLEGLRSQAASRDPITDLSRELATWEDTAAAIHCLDLVITCCTSIAHLSAAMGKKTWVFTPMACFYIWALPGDASPWYEDTRLFRQSVAGSWARETQQIRDALSASSRLANA